MGEGVVKGKGDGLYTFVGPGCSNFTRLYSLTPILKQLSLSPLHHLPPYLGPGDPNLQCIIFELICICSSSHTGP